MPPRKRARVSRAASPDAEPAQKTPTPVASPSKTDELVLNDPWTDDEEIGLFRGLMRWKPTGIHKHFRLLALHAWLLENNYIHPRNAHTKPAGIWAKLGTLYDLAALDAREDARQLSPLRVSPEREEEEENDVDEDADVYSVAANKIESDEFDLTAYAGGDGFEDIMWKRRLPEESDGDSDAELPDVNMAADPPVHFVPSFSIEPAEVATPSSRTAKGKAASARKSGKAAPAPRRSSRKTESVADKEDVAEDDAAEEHEEAGDEEGNEDEEGEEEEESGDEKESQASTPGPRRGRSAKPLQAKVVTKLKGKGRNRGK